MITKINYDMYSKQFLRINNEKIVKNIIVLGNFSSGKS
jgi:hypothetical protein